VSEPRRPDPDELLARVREEEARRARGKLKVFFGAAPGVGKTYSMLENARARRAEGVDVVVGWVQTHGRAETEALLEGLEVLPRRQLSYHGTRLEEFDLDLALERRPTVILVDELAHTNAPGARHTKRFRDVEELLAAGIDVYTTLNVQHLESLNDVVAQITGVTVRETVPDAALDRADEIELVDLPAEDLRKRLAEGKVYIPDQAERAAENFFREGNLIALRELALRRTAERVDAQMQRYRTEHAVSQTWPTAERILVCVGPSPYAARVVRAARQMAARLHGEWLVVSVETPAFLRLPQADREQLQRTLHLADQLGAEVVTLSGHDVAEEILAYARRRNVTQIVVGKPSKPRWRERLRGSFVQRLVRDSGDIGVHVIAGIAEDTPEPLPQPRRWSWRGYGFALAMVGVCSAADGLMLPYFGLANLIMVYLLGVLVVSARTGRGPAVLASLVSVAAFDFLFVPPRLSLTVADTQYLLTFAVMLMVALFISNLTARVREQAEAARARERRTAALYAVSRACASAGETYDVVRIAARHVREVFESQVAVFLPHRSGRLTATFLDGASFADEPKEISVAQWVFDHAEKAGLGTTTLPGSAALYVPLVVSRGPVGVFAVKPGGGYPLDSERIHLLEAFASQIALAVERTNLAAEAQAAELRAETERLRSSLLASVSHDLRTPLAAISGASSALLRGGDELPFETRRELMSSISGEAQRLGRFIANLLEMTRVEAGELTAHKEWQPVEEVVGAALGRLDALLAGREIRTHLPASLPLVPLDAALIEQVLANLLENASKYTPAGSAIDVAVRADGGGVVFEVADRGPGLPAGEESRVFEKFYRASSGLDQSGTGLGLAICRGIVKAHGGTIWAANRVDGGAVFSFRLPIEGTPPEMPLEQL
jgi:two-component system, OmpR family, sensor histidine kinase KdpD